MLRVEDIEQIRRAYHVEKKSIRAISREQGHHRRVIREAVTGTDPEPRRYRRTRPRPRSVVGPVVPIIEGWLVGDQVAPPKQRHTAKRIFDRLVTEHGYAGIERAVREYVHEWKRAQGQHGAAFLPLAYAPGAEAQCDWGEARVRIAGVEQTAQLFCLRLCYSLKPFVCAFPVARQECFLAGHVAAFAFLGGVPERITYDNLTSAVRVVLQGHHRIEQEAFVAFRAHYLFGSHFCLPGEGGAHEKARVERGVQYARESFFRGRDLPDLAAWRAAARTWCTEVAGERIHGTTGERPLERFRAGEQAALQPLPARPWEAVSWTRGVVQADCHLRAGGAWYSVPHAHIRQTLEVRLGERIVEIYDGSTLVTSHPRQERGRVTRTDHYPPAGRIFLTLNPLACRREAQTLGPAASRLVEQLLAEPTLTRLREAQAVLRLADRYLGARVERACGRALAAEDGRFRTVRAILERDLDQQEPEPTPLATYTGAFLRGPDAFGAEVGR